MFWVVIIVAGAFLALTLCGVGIVGAGMFAGAASYTRAREGQFEARRAMEEQMRREEAAAREAQQAAERARQQAEEAQRQADEARQRALETSGAAGGR